MRAAPSALSIQIVHVYGGERAHFNISPGNKSVFGNFLTYARRGRREKRASNIPDDIVVA